MVEEGQQAAGPAAAAVDDACTEPAVAAAKRIVWGVQQPISSSKASDVLQEERDKHRRRAERFGADYVEPGKVRRDLTLEAKRERFSKPGFVTGFDPFSQEELEKKRNRAARFNVENAPEAHYKPAEEVAAKARRAQKFGVEYEPPAAVLMDMDLYASRREVSQDAERRKDTIHLYGVDVMSTDDVHKYFEDFSPKFVEWIDDSSCNVVFADEGSAKRAVVGMGQPLPPAEGTPTAGLDPSDILNLPYLWHQGKDFVKGGTTVHLVYRMAVTSDARNPNEPKMSRHLWKTGGPRVGQKSKARQWESREARGGDQHAGHDEEGDVDMRPVRKRQRGGKRARKGGKVGDADVEMADVEGDHDDRREVSPVDTRGAPGHDDGLAEPVDMGPPRYIAPGAAAGTEAPGDS